MSDTTGHFKKRNQDFPKQVSCRERRKLKARKKDNTGAWFGLGMFGIVGWSVAMPTVAGIFLGVWIDLTWPSSYSWTLMLLLVGLIAGCYNAWYWVQKERKAISNDLNNDNNEY